MPRLSTAWCTAVDYDEDTTLTDFCPAGATLVPTASFPFDTSGGSNISGVAYANGFDVSPATGHTFALAYSDNSSLVRPLTSQPSTTHP